MMSYNYPQSTILANMAEPGESFAPDGGGGPNHAHAGAFTVRGHSSRHTRIVQPTNAAGFTGPLGTSPTSRRGGNGGMRPPVNPNAPALHFPQPPTQQYGLGSAARNDTENT